MPPPQEKKGNLEDIVATLAKVTMDFMVDAKTSFQNQEVAIKNLAIGATSKFCSQQTSR